MVDEDGWTKQISLLTVMLTLRLVYVPSRNQENGKKNEAAQTGTGCKELPLTTGNGSECVIV